MEFRKLASDFHAKEKDVLINCINNNTYELTSYTIYRKGQRIITNEEIERCLKDYEIVEYHRKGDSNRVLIRGKKPELGFNVCMVLDIDKNIVVTVYLNEIKDRHSTLNRQQYISYVNILGLLDNNTYINNKN